MKQMIEDFLLDCTELPDEEIREATEFIYTEFDCTEIYDQIGRLLGYYNATK